MKNYFEGKYKIRYITVGFMFIIVLGIILFYILYYNSIKFGILEIVAYITGSTATMSLLYNSFNLEHQINSQNENNILFKAKYTYDIISEWSKPSMMKSIACTRNLLKNSERIEELGDASKVQKFDEYLTENSKERSHLVLVLNYFENICTMIETGHINDDIVKKAFKSLFISYYRTLKHFIDLRQKEYPDSWMYYEKITKKWIHESKIS